MIRRAAFLLLLALPAVADDWSDFLALAKDKDEGKRCSAIDKIDKYKDLKMVQCLLPLLADAHPRVRYRAMRAIGKTTDDAGVDYLVAHGLKNREPLVRMGAAEALGWIKEKKTVAALTEALSDSNADVRAEVAAALGWLRDPSSADKLAAIYKSEGSWLVKCTVLEALARVAPDKAKELLASAVEDKDYQVRMTAACVYAGYVSTDCPQTGRSCAVLSKDRGFDYEGVDPEGGLTAVAKLIQDKDWRVRVAAIEATTRLRKPACVGWLIDLLLAEKGRLRSDLLIALRDLTDKDIGLDAKAWKAWWEANKETFKVVERVKPKKGEAQEPPRPTPGQTMTTFFTLPVYSTNVVFILDLSGSMRDPGKEEDGRSRGLTKLDIAKKGMVDTIKAFPQDVRFSIIGLGSDEGGQFTLKKQKTFRGKLQLQPATSATKLDAEKFVRGLEAKGWTNIYDAIEYAYEDPEVDTIFLYTDGGASKGVFTMTDEIMTFVDRMNRFRRVQICTIEVPGEKENTKDNIRLLQELAMHTKGSYKLFEPKK